MANDATTVLGEQRSKQIARLQYVADQLREYSIESQDKNDVLEVFADMLDGIASELVTAQFPQIAPTLDSAHSLN